MRASSCQGSHNLLVFVNFEENLRETSSVRQVVPPEHLKRGEQRRERASTIADSYLNAESLRTAHRTMNVKLACNHDGVCIYTDSIS